MEAEGATEEGDDLEGICKLVKEVCESSEAGVSYVSNISDTSDISEISEIKSDGTKEPLGDNTALEDATADDAMTRTPKKL